MSLADRYDVIVIGAGFSGLAAGIRLAQYDRSVVVLERHSLYGGLNSFYKRGGRRIDTGLHALTNFVKKGDARAPLSKLLRQLRIPYDALALGEQSHSEIVFPSTRLSFSNDFELLRAEVASTFPRARDAFDRLVREIDAHDLAAMPSTAVSARSVLREKLGEPLLEEMLLCPIAYYGSAQEHDVDWHLFATLFRSIFREGLAHPEGGIRRVLDLFVRRLRDAGGTLALNTGVKRVLLAGTRAIGVELDDGRTIEASEILSSAGAVETEALCGERDARGERVALRDLARSDVRHSDVRRSDVGRISVVETISILDRTHASLGHEATMTFFSTRDRFRYARPEELVDLESGVLCCTDNYRSATPPTEGVQRATVLANFDRWAELGEAEYRAAKASVAERVLDLTARYAPDPRPHTVLSDLFTPRTIRHYTGREQGALYGSPTKHYDGATGYENLHLIGTDQGLVGVVGAALSGITMANRHLLVAHGGAR